MTVFLLFAHSLVSLGRNALILLREQYVLAQQTPRNMQNKEKVYQLCSALDEKVVDEVEHNQEQDSGVPLCAFVLIYVLG